MFSFSFRRTIFMFCLLAAAGCAAGKTAVKTPQSVEPYLDKVKYMSAAASGQSADEAALRAKAELSAIFESKVAGEVLSEVGSVTGADGKETVTRRAEQNVRVLSSVELEGVEIGGTWFDEGEKAYRAVAVLDRQKASAGWRGEIGNINAKAEAILQSLDSQKSGFGRLLQLRKVERLWLEKEVVKSRLRVIGSGSGDDGTIEIAAVLKEIGRRQAEILVYIDMGGENGKVLGEGIAEALASAGFNMTRSAESASLHVKGKMEVTHLDLKDPSWEFARAVANVAILDRTAGITVGEITENKRVSHRTFNEASNRAARAVTSVVAKRVADFIGGAE